MRTLSLSRVLFFLLCIDIYFDHTWHRPCRCLTKFKTQSCHASLLLPPHIIARTTCLWTHRWYSLSTIASSCLLHRPRISSQHTWLTVDFAWIAQINSAPQRQCIMALHSRCTLRVTNSLADNLCSLPILFSLLYSTSFLSSGAKQTPLFRAHTCLLCSSLLIFALLRIKRQYGYRYDTMQLKTLTYVEYRKSDPCGLQSTRTSKRYIVHHIAVEQASE